jgi:hypothetical protein
MTDEPNISIAFLQRKLQEANSESGRLKSGGGGGTSDGMEPRVAKLEAAVEHIQKDISEIKTDIRGLRDMQWSHFLILFGAIIFVALGLAGLMARGFKWL